MSHRTVAPQGGPSVEVPNNLPGNFASVQRRWHEERQGEPGDWAMPNTPGSSRLMQHKEMYRTGDARRIAWRPNPCVPLMEVQRAADCVGERIESTKRWRGQEIVHTPGSFSSLAAELLQCHARGLNLKGINRRKYHLRSVNIKHGRGCKNGRPPTVGRDMCLTRKDWLAAGIRPDDTRFEGPHQAAVVLTVKGEGLPTSELLQKKVAVGLHVLEDRRCVARFQSACHDKPHAPGRLDRTFERHSASTGRGIGIGITKIRHSCDWDMNFKPMQWPIAWAGASKPLCLFLRGKGLSTCLQLLKGVMHMQELSVLPGSYGESRVPELRLGQAV